MLFEESDLLWIFDRRNVSQNLQKVRLGVTKRAFGRFFGAGSAGRAAVVGGFWSLTRTDESLQALFARSSHTLCPQRGAADLNAPSGVSTAAPYFVARRLQLIAFCK